VGVDANMVEAGADQRSRQTTVLSGISSASRLTRWIRADAADGPAGAPRPPDDEVGRADLVGELDDIVGALGCTTTIPVGVSARERLEWAAGTAEDEQCPFHNKSVPP